MGNKSPMKKEKKKKKAEKKFVAPISVVSSVSTPVKKPE